LRLTKLYIRFYKSFNYDYERKAHPEAIPLEWEQIEHRWFPFVQVPIEPMVTAVVGANESGKSHLIKAIRLALTGTGIERRDFCRYSSLYSVETGELRVPDLGVEVDVEEHDAQALTAVGMNVSAGQRLTRLRLDGGVSRVHDSSGEQIELNAEQLEQLDALLPVPFELETDVSLPDSISIDALLGRERSPLARPQRFDLANLLRGVGVVNLPSPSVRAKSLPCSRARMIRDGEQSERRTLRESWYST